MNLGAVFARDIGTVVREIRDEMYETVEAEIGDASRALRAELRAQTLAAGLGAGNANAWRVRMYRDRSGRATVGFVWSRAPLIMAAFEAGLEIVPKTKGRALAIPTGFNRAGGRRGAKVLVTPQQMLGQGNSFVTKVKGKPHLRLWWLRVNKAARVRHYKASKNLPERYVRQGITDAYIAGGRAIRDRRRRDLAVRFGAVPMFVLARRVRLGKRLDIAGAAERAVSALAARIPAGWRGRG